MAHDVFVSYSSLDKPVADALCATLESRKIRCWIAPRDVLPGVSYPEALIGALNASSVMVLLFSSHSNVSEQVKSEVERAVSKKIPIIAFRIEDVPLSPDMEFFLSRRHWLDALSPPLERHLNLLADSVASLLAARSGMSERERPPAGAPASSPVKEASHPQPRFATVGRSLAAGPVPLGIALSVIVLAAMWLVWMGGQQVHNPAAAAVPRAVSPPTAVSAVVPQATAAPALISQPSSTAATPLEKASPSPASAPARARNALSSVGIYSTSRKLEDIVVQGKTGYLANGGDGLVILDLSDPSKLAELGQYRMEGAVSVAVADGLAFVVQSGMTQGNRILPDQLAVLDVKTPSKPTLLGEYKPAPGHDRFRVALGKGLAALATHNYVELLDVSDPSRPTRLWQWEPATNTGNPCVAHFAGNILLVAAGWAGVHLFDLSNPAAPAKLAQFDTPDWAIDLAVAGDVAYVSLGDQGLMTLDISNPARPKMIGRVKLQAFASRVATAEGTVYASLVKYEQAGPPSTTGGVPLSLFNVAIAAVDVKDPSNPAVIGQSDTLGFVSSLYTANGLLYAAVDSQGLNVLRPNW